MNPLVSVIIPTYKRSEMLPRAIDSVLAQTYENVQVIVVDDNDPNSEYRKCTENRMKFYANDGRVKYIRHSQNSNGSVARNTGIKNADGEIITFLDDDDTYLADKVKKQVAFLQENLQYRAVYCGWKRKINFIPSHQGDLSYDLLSGDNIIYTNAIMMWKKDALLCGGWDESFVRHQEAAFLLRYFSKGGQIGVVPESLIEFDISDRSNATTDPQKNEQQVFHLLENYEKQIFLCEKTKRGASINIYSHRYRGIFLAYIKAHNFKGAIFFYIKTIRKYPVKFNVVLGEYLIKRLFIAK